MCVSSGSVPRERVGVDGARRAGAEPRPERDRPQPEHEQSAIQAKLDAISTQQVRNQFGTQRYAILFEPGTYGSAVDPLVFQVGYYTQVAGLGAEPGDVVINGAIDVFNGSDGTAATPKTSGVRSRTSRSTSRCPSSPPDYAPAPPRIGRGAQTNSEFWAVSQAAPMRRVIVNGQHLSRTLRLLQHGVRQRRVLRR